METDRNRKCPPSGKKLLTFPLVKKAAIDGEIKIYGLYYNLRPVSVPDRVKGIDSAIPVDLILFWITPPVARRGECGLPLFSRRGGAPSKAAVLLARGGMGATAPIIMTGPDNRPKPDKGGGG